MSTRTSAARRSLSATARSTIASTPRAAAAGALHPDAVRIWGAEQVPVGAAAVAEGDAPNNRQIVAPIAMPTRGFIGRNHRSPFASRTVSDTVVKQCQILDRRALVLARANQREG